MYGLTVHLFETCLESYLYNVVSWAYHKQIYILETHKSEQYRISILTEYISVLLLFPLVT